mgnify:CR=1 FL=1
MDQTAEKLDENHLYRDFASAEEYEEVQQELFAKGYAWPTGHTSVTRLPARALHNDFRGRVWAGRASFSHPGCVGTLGNDGLTMYTRIETA